MKRYSFQKTHWWEQYLTFFDLYSLQSQVDAKTYYAIDENDFAILRHKDGARWKIEDTPEVVKRITYEPIRQEIMEIYEDIKDLKRMDIIYSH